VAKRFEDASRAYAANPTALDLRAMNMLYEGLKQNATFVIVPSTALDTMQLGGANRLVREPTVEQVPASH
jgi:regulator of protease activity HflC (stomatin/prohibitin superfamily)